jgi:hypothetical protein
VLLGRSEAMTLLKGAGLRPGESSNIFFWPKRSAFAESLERGLGWLPIGAQYYVWGLVAA